jgi:ZIP family zinc transporter
MITFVSLLLLAAGAQVFGALLSWLFVKRFCSNIRAVVLVEAVLMAAVSLVLIEEGLKITSLVFAGAVIGIAAFGVLNRVVPHKHETQAERIGSLVFIAMCFHELPEGIAFGSSYLIDPGLGLATAFLIGLHNLPEGSIVSVPFFIKKRFAAGFKAVLATQLLYIIGGLAAYCLLLNVSEYAQALAMSFAAGVMLYIVFEEIGMARRCS